MISKQWWTSKECSHCPWPPSKLVRNHQWMHGLLPHILLARLFLVLVVHLLCCYCAFSLSISAPRFRLKPIQTSLLWCSWQDHVQRWKMLEIRERGGSLGRGGAGKTFWEEMWRGGGPEVHPPAASPSQFIFWRLKWSLSMKFEHHRDMSGCRSVDCVKLNIYELGKGKVMKCLK